MHTLGAHNIFKYNYIPTVLYNLSHHRSSSVFLYGSHLPLPLAFSLVFQLTNWMVCEHSERGEKSFHFLDPQVSGNRKLN